MPNLPIYMMSIFKISELVARRPGKINTSYGCGGGKGIEC